MTAPTNALDAQRRLVDKHPHLLETIPSQDKHDLEQVVNVFNDILEENHRKLLLARVRHFWKIHMDTGIDLILSGHLHDTLESYQDRAYKLSTPGPLLIQAGTAISTRQRGEKNSFNVITYAVGHIAIDRYEYVSEKQTFAIKKTEHFIRQSKAWVRDIGC